MIIFFLDKELERELHQERARKEELDSLTTGWNEVAMGKFYSLI